jgi:hypothetical protein
VAGPGTRPAPKRSAAPTATAAEPAAAESPADAAAPTAAEPSAAEPSAAEPTAALQPPAEPSAAEPPADAAEPTAGGAAAAVPASPGGTAVTLAQLQGAWEGQVLANLAIPVRSKWRGGRWIEPDGTTLRFAVDNEWHRRVCEETRREVEGVLTAHFGTPTVVAVVVEGGGGRPGAGPAGRGPAQAPAGDRGGAPGPDDRDDEHIDPAELRDAGDTVGGVDLLVREFGAQLVEEDQR